MRRVGILLESASARAAAHATPLAGADRGLLPAARAGRVTGQRRPDGGTRIAG